MTNPAGADELVAPLVLLLTGSAVGVAERMMPNVSWSRFALNLARQPRTLGSRASSLIQELVSIAEGHSEIEPAKGDKRFNDAAWQGNPLLKRSMQMYLATIKTVDELFADANLDWRDAERIRFALDVITEGLAPSNNPLLSQGDRLASLTLMVTVLDQRKAGFADNPSVTTSNAKRIRSASRQAVRDRGHLPMSGTESSTRRRRSSAGGATVVVGRYNRYTSIREPMITVRSPGKPKYWPRRR